MRITVIPSDNFVSIDNETYYNVDLSFLDSNIHAIQWYHTEGELELKNEKNIIVSNKYINSFEEYSRVIMAWRCAKEEYELFIAENNKLIEKYNLENSITNLNN